MAKLSSNIEIDRRILTIRGCKVILDSHLAAIYGVTAKRLNQQLSRNRKKFPGDFTFRLTADEWEALRLQIATLNVVQSPCSTTDAAGTHYQVGLWTLVQMLLAGLVLGAIYRTAPVREVPAQALSALETK